MTTHRATTEATLGLVAAIEAAYPVIGGRDEFLADPGGWIDYLSPTEDNDVAAAAIKFIEMHT
jgi:hypothetical protein